MCMGRDAKDAAYGMDAQGWHARTTEMIRPNMKKRNSATSLLACCALSPAHAAEDIAPTKNRRFVAHT